MSSCVKTHATDDIQSTVCMLNGTTENGQ